jgi:hypothetical protein
LAESFTVSPYSAENLASALTNALTPPSKFKLRMPYKYFCEYFGDQDDGLGAKTIVIEKKYISKSYLIDYSNYYSTCFSDYERFCKRVHFFSRDFSEADFEAALKDSIADSPIWESYLGYIVVKPLPLLTIGATLLKTYESTPTNKRIFHAIEKYPVNLFGKELTVQSLAFQEQDSVVGACASSALWTAFHKTSKLFQTSLPSPSDITRSAKNLFQNSGRTYPNTGLDHYQIGNAIDATGMVSELRNSDKFRGEVDRLKAFIYAYNSMGLPVLLGIKFPEGGHLITVVGYKESNDNNFPRTSRMALKSSKIERFYAHDDQVGPFSRLGFDASGNILTSWVDDTGSHKTAELVSVFIPIHNKIRINFEDIFSKASFIDFYFSKVFPTLEIHWDIQLCLSNKYKESIYDSTISSGMKYSLLTTPLPKYLWIAKGFVGNECIIEFLFDATQIATADYCIGINIYNDSLRGLINGDLLNTTTQDYFLEYLGSKFLELITQSSS